MKFSLERDALTSALAAATRAIPKRDPIVCVTRGATGLLFTCDDLIARITGVIDVDSDEIPQDLRVGLPAKPFADMVKAFPAGPIAFEADGEAWKLTGGRSTMAMRTIARDIPTSPAPLDDIGTVDSAAIIAAIDSVAPAASTDESRPILTGVLFEPAASHLRLVGTNSYRLHVAEAHVSNAAIGEKALVPAATLVHIAALLSGDVMVRRGPNEIEFDDGRRSIRSRLIEGDYPRWESLVEGAGKEPATTAVVDTAGFREAVKNAAKILATELPLHITFRPDDTSVFLEALNNGEGLEFSTEIGAEVLEGAESTVAVNAVYLSEALAANPDTQTHVSVTDALKPVLLTAPKPSVFTSIVMPVRTS